MDHTIGDLNAGNMVSDADADVLPNFGGRRVIVSHPRMMGGKSVDGTLRISVRRARPRPSMARQMSAAIPHAEND